MNFNSTMETPPNGDQRTQRRVPRVVPGRAGVLTASVDALPSDVKAMANRQGGHLCGITSDNDPHGEHDFGSFELAGNKFFWKIDYYDRRLKWGSEDPADPEKPLASSRSCSRRT